MAEKGVGWWPNIEGLPKSRAQSWGQNKGRGTKQVGAENGWAQNREP